MPICLLREFNTPLPAKSSHTVILQHKITNKTYRKRILPSSSAYIADFKCNSVESSKSCQTMDKVRNYSGGAAKTLWLITSSLWDGDTHYAQICLPSLLNRQISRHVCVVSRLAATDEVERNSSLPDMPDKYMGDTTFTRPLAYISHFRRCRLSKPEHYIYMLKDRPRF